MSKDFAVYLCVISWNYLIGFEAKNFDWSYLFEHCFTIIMLIIQVPHLNFNYTYPRTWGTKYQNSVSIVLEKKKVWNNFAISKIM